MEEELATEIVDSFARASPPRDGIEDKREDEEDDAERLWDSHETAPGDSCLSSFSASSLIEEFDRI